MFVAVDTEGQLCNRLWGFLPLLHHQRLTGEPVRVLFFDAYTSNFPSLTTARTFRCLRLWLKGSLYRKTIILVRRLLNNRRLTYNRPYHQHTGPLSLVVAWDHREEIHDEKTRELAVQLFRPTDAVIKRIEHTMMDLRLQGHIVLGVHIRRRDYRDFFEGRYFYSNAEYVLFIHQIKQQVEALGCKLTCLLCSDEPVDLDAFQGLDVHCIQQASPLEDLYALSYCDLMVGPPSTFSQWASYYGQVPLWLVWDKTQAIKLMDFGVITKLDHSKPVDMTAWLRERSNLGCNPLVSS